MSQKLDIPTLNIPRRTSRYVFKIYDFPEPTIEYIECRGSRLTSHTGHIGRNYGSKVPTGYIYILDTFLNLL